MLKLKVSGGVREQLAVVGAHGPGPSGPVVGWLECACPVLQ